MSAGPIEEELAGWGKVILLETRGRVTRRPVTAAVGYLEQPDGTLLVAAGSPDAHWARNLLADPRCRVTREGRTEPYSAQELEGDERDRAVVALILKYGTPAEGLGSGPVFELRPEAS